MEFAPQQQFSPAISEAAKPRRPARFRSGGTGSVSSHFSVISDCGLRIADLAQRSATGLPLDHYMIWKQFRIAERGYGISDSQISEPLAILLQAAETLKLRGCC
jgi:hypothetical protein